jgi:hypothetical protein
MKCFKSLIRGDNFPGQLIEKVERVGFYTTRFIRCEDSADAEAAVIALMQSDPKLNSVRSADFSEAKIYVEEIVESPTPEDSAIPGFAWYQMKLKKRSKKR